MPMYEVEHICPLSEKQQDTLAEAITRIHSEQFSTPKLFVNVRFTNIAHHLTYVAGKRRKSNRVIGQLRSGPARRQESYDAICAEIGAVWSSVVGMKGDQELRAIFIVGGLVAGAECGFPIPQAGEDATWLKKYVSEFQKLASEGDEDFKDLMEELRSRSVFKDAVANVNGNGD